MFCGQKDGQRGTCGSLWVVDERERERKRETGRTETCFPSRHLTLQLVVPVFFEAYRQVASATLGVFQRALSIIDTAVFRFLCRACTPACNMNDEQQMALQAVFIFCNLSSVCFHKYAYVSWIVLSQNTSEKDEGQQTKTVDRVN